MWHIHCKQVVNPEFFSLIHSFAGVGAYCKIQDIHAKVTTFSQPVSKFIIFQLFIFKVKLAMTVTMCLLFRLSHFSFIMACLLSLFLYKNVTTNDFINLFTWCPVHNMKNTTNRWAAFVALCKCVSYYRQAVILNACMHCTATSVAVDTRSVYLSTAHDHGTFLAIWLRSMAIFTTGQQVRRRTWPMTRS